MFKNGIQYIRTIKACIVKFYQYRQNNSGGDFYTDENLGIEVLIAAKNADEADERATELGIYFDGCYNGYDCSCCGDRWSTASDWNAVEPNKLDEYIQESLNARYSYPWGDPYIIVHHDNGDKQSYTHPKWEEGKGRK